MKKLLLLFTLSAIAPLCALADEDVVQNQISSRPVAETSNGGDDRWTTSFTISGENENSLTVYTGATEKAHATYIDKTDQVLPVQPGEILTLSFEADGTKGGLSAFLYVDYDGDGALTFDSTLDYYTNHPYAGSADHNELVTFNAYRFYVTTAKNYHNSDGTDLGTSSPSSWTSAEANQSLPKIKIPEDLAPGKYYARFKTDWNYINCPGELTKNNGVLIDFYIEIPASDVAAPVNITAPTEDGCSLRVINTSADNAEVTSGTELLAGNVLQIIPTVSDDYMLQSVTANGHDIDANAQGEYFYTTLGEEVTIAASFVKKTDYRPTIKYSLTGDEGTVKVLSNGEEIESGDTVAYGSQITVEVSYAFYSSVAVNGADVDCVDGVYSFTATTNMAITIDLNRKYTASTGTTSASDERWLSSITLSGNDNSSLNISTGATGKAHAAWVDATDHIFQVRSGETISVAQEGTGGGLTSHLVIDYNQNGEFDNLKTDEAYYIGDEEKDPMNELVTFNAHRWGSSSAGALFYDSTGAEIDATTPKSWSLNDASARIPSFTIPASLEVGKYYARFIVTYNDLSATSGYVSYNGVALDFLFEVIGKESAINSIAMPSNENAPAEYFNLQGVRVANPTPGLYIVRQGSKATKVVVK